MLTVSNALLMSSVTAIVRSGGLFWLKHVAMVLFMLCSLLLSCHQTTFFHFPTHFLTFSLNF